MANFRAEGLIADVIEEVESADNQGDTGQFERIRSFVLAELAAWPTGPGAPNGALVEFAGYHDDASSNATVMMRPVRVGEPED